MKAEDLRIGNLVTIENEVIKLNARMLFHFAESGLKCEPIPLTEEWLLKFGFEKDNHADSFHIFKVGFEIYVDEDMCVFVEATATNINYVHQLQNLYFALTGEELIIKE